MAKQSRHARSAFVLSLLAAGAMADITESMAQPAPATPVREIVKITDQLYRFRENRHYGAFLVTGSGIILVDPANTGVAQWLKGELQQRFAQPVRYVLYSHSHNDHASGGAAFGDTATFIGHAAMLQNLQRPPASAPLTAREKLWDSNRDGLVQEAEARGTYYQDEFARWDRDGNGGLSRQEIWAARFEGEVRLPDITYTDRVTVRLGGMTVELTHLVPNHSNDMSLIRFPTERAIYVADFLTPNRLPRTDLDGGVLPGWVDALKQVEQMDFDIVVPGHEAPGTKAQVGEQRRYLEELVAEVERNMRAGLSKEQTIDKVRMPAYAHLLEYAMSRPGNVRGVYEMLQTAQK